MTKEELEKTNWAKEFKADSPVSYHQALELALTKKLDVEIAKTDENEDRPWAISVIDGIHDGFLMDFRKTKKEALGFCRQMGWKIVRQ